MVAAVVMTSILGRLKTITATRIVPEPKPGKSRVSSVAIDTETLFIHHGTKSQVRPQVGDRVLINVLETDGDFLAVEVYSGALPVE